MKQQREGKFVCVGLDPDMELMPTEAIQKSSLIAKGDRARIAEAFLFSVIEQTADVAVAYKANRAFYDALRGYLGGVIFPETGNALLARMRRYIPSRALFILDGKFGDVGNTSQRQARYAFVGVAANAATLNPYGGFEDGLDAFLADSAGFSFVWCLGSNKGASEFQKVTSMVHGSEMKRLLSGPARSVDTIRNFGQINEWVEYPIPFYQRVALRVANHWNTRGNCGVVVGATNPKELAIVRELVGDMPILIPGIGEQEGDLAAAVRAAVYVDPSSGKKSFPALINSSRGILYGSEARDSGKAMREIGERAKRLNEDIKATLKQEGVGL